MISYWTPEKDALIAQRRSEDVSAADIANELARTFGGSPSRSAVIGRAKRLGLERMESKTKRLLMSAAGHARADAMNVLGLPLIPRKLPKSGAGSVAFMERRLDQCAWPLWGDPRPPLSEMFVCGNPVHSGSYCALHYVKKLQRDYNRADPIAAMKRRKLNKTLQRRFMEAAE